VSRVAPGGAPAEAYSASVSRFAVVAVVLILGCDGGSTPSSDAGAAESRGAGEAVDAVVAAPLQRIWGPDSQRLELRCSDGWGSLSNFAANRDELTPAQLLAADSLRARLEGIDSTCFFDGTSCMVDIVAAGGQHTRARGELSDCDERYRGITAASLRPLYELLDCRGLSLSTQAVLRPDAYCERGLHAAGPRDVWVQVPDAGSYQFELAACALPGLPRPVRMQLQDEAGNVLLEGSTPADPGPKQICQRMVYTFAQPGRFSVRVHDGLEQALWAMTLRFAQVAPLP
jgi:hypothetical protein